MRLLYPNLPPFCKFLLRKSLLILLSRKAKAPMASLGPYGMPMRIGTTRRETKAYRQPPASRTAVAAGTLHPRIEQILATSAGPPRYHLTEDLILQNSCANLKNFTNMAEWRNIAKRNEVKEEGLEYYFLMNNVPNACEIIKKRLAQRRAAATAAEVARTAAAPKKRLVEPAEPEPSWSQVFRYH